jgi:hypothetical protein
MLIWVPELWPEIAQEWYARYDRYYWQEGWFLAGFREFSEGSSSPEWFFADVDAGPVIGGYGVAASAFGIGATRANGRFDQAYPLSAEALVASWPLADGTLLGARLLSNLSDAPYLGESALLFTLTRTPLTRLTSVNKGKLPFVVYVGISIYALLGAVIIGFSGVSIRKWYTVRLAKYYFPLQYFQLLGWFILMTTGLVICTFLHSLVGIFIVLLAQFLPRGQELKADKTKTKKGDWDNVSVH